MRKFWIEIRSSLWFVPGALVLAAIGLALGLVELDERFGDQLRPWGWLPFLKAGAEGARSMLTAIASSMITVAGVAFSITIVTLSLASTQYTPRILRNFMRDRANQSVLGVFVGIYAYCLIVLRTIRGGYEDGFVPLIAVFAGVLLALVGIGYLIFFIHHTAASIQASYILDAITNETLAAIDTLFPQKLGEPDESSPATAAESTAWHPVSSPATGYIQSVDRDALWRLADERDMLVRQELEAGDFVVEGAPIISGDRISDDDAAAALRRVFAIGNFRTVDQDAGFGIRQIVDIAMKALSPGVNDTSTAVSCVDYLSAILSVLAQRRLDSPFRRGEGDQRVIAPVPLFADFVAKSLDEIRLSAAGNVSVILRMLRLLTRVAQVTDAAARRLALLDQARIISSLADSSVPVPHDRARINAELDALRLALSAGEQLPALATTGAA